ncbi:MAG: DinB family protein [Phycisphaeraceae bacterium]|nr:DinB family protein [Phycisphaeraceae bacterium]
MTAIQSTQAQLRPLGMIGLTRDNRSSAASPASHFAGPLAGPVVELLRELAGVVAALTAEQYTRRADDAFFKGTIGGHVRHCLDHIRALVRGVSGDVVEYDRRLRGTEIETDPIAAREEIRGLRREIDDVASLSLDLPLTVRLLPTKDGAPVDLRSTLGRELAFVLSHTIHHNATIKGMAVDLGVSLPGSFGYAPATLAHQSASAKGNSACAH